MKIGKRQLPQWLISFGIIWIGQAFSILGSSLVSFGLVWWLTEETGSATVLATSTLVAMLPGVFIGPFAGALIDRWNRRRVMIVADGTVALATAVLVYLFAVGAIEVWHVYVIMLIRSVTGSFHFPAMQASVSLMVPDEHLARVSGMNQMLHGGINIVAPPLGALLLETLPMQGMLSVDIVTASIAITTLLFVAIPQPKRVLANGEEGKPSFLQDMRAGLRYVANWRGLQIILLMATMINALFTPAFSLIPLLVKDHFDGGATQLGFMNSAWGVGVVLGGLALGIWGGFKRKIYTSMMGLIGMGLGTMFIGIAPADMFFVAVAAMFVGGVMNPITNGPLFAVLQSKVAPEMQGRVFTLTTSGATGASLVSLMLAGPIADTVGVQPLYVIGGLFCALMGVSGYFIQDLRRMEDHQAPAEAEEAAPPGEPVEDDPKRAATGGAYMLDTPLN
jgi:DHA3 family macrolide efflux protein-like MFS transporter